MERMREKDYCQVCGEDMLVQVGNEKTPLCADHFNDYLAKVRQTVEALKSAPRKT
jgi:hypothetical protein